MREQTNFLWSLSGLRAMSHLQFYLVILSRNFTARKRPICNCACCNWNRSHKHDVCTTFPLLWPSFTNWNCEIVSIFFLLFWAFSM